MMFATMVHMNSGCEGSNDLLDIHSMFIVGWVEDKYLTKEEIHDYLRNHPNSMKADVFPYSFLVPMSGPNGEKYVQSTNNGAGCDTLMELPRG
jgi:hypothetical protein